ncbi:MAG: BlaI/MecI/CopY family transcriptional regulator [Clostridiales bacterium]|jgi:BlaI family penicillinase repressor|nr:BlaI/MecI/CopY family transcriptional regulator [Clostridiales bacterium]MCI2161662.1 BlaI/MecI/CopY family transcriptional regulator [Oscillospiraceae bacterium]MCI1961445.1 BlaI/MecI/CopY family transcriptional regulator [Clostridiales bacterium]MCI2022146.1 BlaI/MecI/CopY family transcriptional regulator [Clostridiales bacterium]MCI2025839.1 BlaI/MecI/CopY family transcriptional regulator [Clostridiales bacterium]
MSNKNVSISEAEWQVMKVLWENAPQPLTEIIDHLSGTGWSTTTIQTYLARLVKKSALSTERKGKGFLYTPTVSEQECQISESKSFLNRVFGGSVSSMVTSFIKSGNLSESELEQLRKLISEQERKKQNDDH